MATSKIEWTEAVWNPVTGCSKVSPGCKNCYAETIANRFWKDRKFTDVICHEDRLQQPLHWKKPRMIFVNSMSDLFHEEVDFTFINSIYEVMGYSKQHTFQILTKRPDIALEYYKWTRIFDAWSEWKNIWLGVSVENQKTADERIPILLKTPAAMRFISCEPLLESIDISKYVETHLKKINWVIVGGESGPNKRPFDPDWARSIRDACRHAQVPFFMKQVDKVRPIPEDLQIMEYPNANTRI